MGIDKRPLFYNYVKYNNKIWFWDTAHNGLFFCEHGFVEAEQIPLSCYAEYPQFDGSLYGKILLYKNKLVLAPRKADKILIYEPDVRQERYIALPDIPWDETALNQGKFVDVTVEGSKAFLTGSWSSYLIKLDLDEERIKGYVDLYCGRKRRKNDVYFKYAGIYGSKLIVPSCLENVIFMVDTYTLKYYVKTVNGIENGFSAFYIDNDTVWLTPRRNGSIVRWNIKKDEVKLFRDYPEGFDFGERKSFGHMEAYGNILYLFPLRANAVLSMDKNTGKFLIEEKLTECIREQMGGKFDSVTKCYFTEVNGNKLFVYCGSRSLIEYQLTDKTIKITEIQLSEEDYHKYSHERIYAILDKGSELREKEGEFREFLKYVIRAKTMKKDKS